MNARVKIEVDVATAKELEARAAEQGVSVSDLVAQLLAAQDGLPPELEAKPAAAEGPWSAEETAELDRRWAEFERTREGVPWDEVRAWMQSWGKPDELPPPKPRKL
jgi:hypothetical protein